MKQQFQIIIACLLILSLLCSCAGDTPSATSNLSSKSPVISLDSEPTFESNSQEEQSSDVDSQPEPPSVNTNTSMKASSLQQTLSSQVKIDADVFVPDNIDFSNLKTYKGEMLRLDMEAIKEDLFGAGAEVKETRQESKESKFPDEDYILWEGNDGSYLAGMGDMINFSSGKMPDVKPYLFLETSAAEYNGDAFLSGKKLDFATEQESFTLVRGLLDKLGVSISENYLCYTIDHDTLRKEAEIYRSALVQNMQETGIKNENGTDMTEDDILAHMPDPNYTVEDDCYYFKLFASAEGYPVTQIENGIFANGGLTPGSVANAIVSQDGVVHLYLYDLYESSEVMQEGAGLNLDDAIAALDEKYNSIILDGDYEVQEIAFEYVPVSQGDVLSVELTPAWRFVVKHSVETMGKADNSLYTIDQYEYVMLNALTGEEILRDMGGV